MRWRNSLHSLAKARSTWSFQISESRSSGSRLTTMATTKKARTARDTHRAVRRIGVSSDWRDVLSPRRLAKGSPVGEWDGHLVRELEPGKMDAHRREFGRPFHLSLQDRKVLGPRCIRIRWVAKWFTGAPVYAVISIFRHSRLHEPLPRLSDLRPVPWSSRAR